MFELEFNEICIKFQWPTIERKIFGIFFGYERFGALKFL